MTNVIGAQNVIASSLNSVVKSVVALSTDKATGPVNLYGASELCSDKFIGIALHNFLASRTNVGIITLPTHPCTNTGPGAFNSVLSIWIPIVPRRPLVEMVKAIDDSKNRCPWSVDDN